MVAAMRFWLQAVGLLTELPREQMGRKVSFTDFGQLVWQADPYLEQIETVWLLHLHLVKNRCLAPSGPGFLTPMHLWDHLICLPVLIAYSTGS